MRLAFVRVRRFRVNNQLNTESFSADAPVGAERPKKLPKMRWILALGAIAGISFALWFSGVLSNKVVTQSLQPNQTASPTSAGILTAEQINRLGIKTISALSAQTAPVGAMPAMVVLPPDARVAVSAPFSGSIRQIFVIPGQQVAKGQVLATIMSRDALQIGADLKRARTDLGLARATAARTEQLVREGIIAGARAQEARAALAHAETNISEKSRILAISGANASGLITLHAPIAGRISAVSVQTGGPIDGMTAPFVIDASNAYQLDIQVPERLAETVKPGMAVTLPGNIGGRILSVSPGIDPVSRSLIAKASISAAPGIIAGKSLIVSVEGAAPMDAVLVPASALTKVDGKDVVFVATANGFTTRQVVAAPAGMGNVLIASGLKPGERVATSGLTELKMLMGGE
jgi:membrane fusion protein, heavy metal efflux system